MRTFVLLISLLLAAPAVLAAGKLYKWTDEHGVTHYTDEPPAGRDFEARNLPRDANAERADTADEQAEDDQAQAPNPAAVRNAENCRVLRRNVEGLQIPGAVRMDLDGDGEPEVLNDEQKAQQLDIAQRQLAAYCDEKPADDTLDPDANDAY